MSTQISEWDQHRFDEALKAYVMFSRRTIPQIINTKAYYIARRALWLTGKAKFTDFDRELKMPGKRDKKAPLAALIINSRRGKDGAKGLYGKDMKAAIRVMLRMRKRSIGFLKAGWLPAIKDIAPFVPSKTGAAPLDRTVKQWSKPRGKGVPAREGLEITATIVNTALALRTSKRDALALIAGPPLEQAFRDETAGMIDYVKAKLATGTAKANRTLA